MDEDFWGAQHLLSVCYEIKGLRDEAIAGYLKAHANRRDLSADQIAMLKDAYAASGWNGYWQKELDLAEQKRARGENVSLYEMAWICVRLGEKDQAFELLEKAYQERGSNLWRIRAESAFDSLHQDPRFKDLVRRLELPQ